MATRVACGTVWHVAHTHTQSAAHAFICVCNLMPGNHSFIHTFPGRVRSASTRVASKVPASASFSISHFLLPSLPANSITYGFKQLLSLASDTRTQEEVRVGGEEASNWVQLKWQTIGWGLSKFIMQDAVN